MKKKNLVLSILFGLIFVVNASAQNSNKLTTRTINRDALIQEENDKNFRFTIGGGYSRWLGDTYDTKNSQNDFISGLRNGYNLDAEAQYYFNKNIGAGINGTMNRYENDKLSTFGLKETDKMLFIGAMCNVRYMVNRWAFYVGTGLGPIFYTTEGTVNQQNLSYSKTVFGFNSNIACEYRLNETVGAGLKLAVTSGSYKERNTNEKASTSSFFITGFLSFRTK